MNCKPGDLAIVKLSKEYPEHVGKVVLILRAAAHGTGEPAWWFEPGLPNRKNESDPIRGALDRCLRPVRLSDGEDETLTWAGKPNETPADVIKTVSLGKS